MGPELQIALTCLTNLIIFIIIAVCLIFVVGSICDG